MAKNFLPIGSVVLLKNSTAKLMIAGYLATGGENTDVWDYTGFRFPSGYMDINEVYLFNHEQIDNIVALGYQDEEQFVFIQKLSLLQEQQSEGDQE